MSQHEGQDGLAMNAESRRWSVILKALLPVTVVLAAFDLASSRLKLAARGIFTNFPPFYAHFAIVISPYAALSVTAALGFVLLIALGAMERMSDKAFLPTTIVMFFVLAGALGLARGNPSDLIDPLQRRSTLVDFQQDVQVLEHYGLRSFVDRYPELIQTNVVGRDKTFAQSDKLHSIHSISHPPGNIVVMWIFSSVSSNLYVRAALIAFLAALVLVPTWFLARFVGDREVARIAVVLLAAAPGPLLYAFTSFDAVAATILTTTTALFVGAVHRESRRLAVLAGANSALAMFFVYQTSFIAYFAVLYALVAVGWRKALRLAFFSGLGTLATFVALRLTLGFDLIATLRASLSAVYYHTSRSYWYWLFGNWGAWLTFAGVPIAGFGLVQAIRHRDRLLLAFFIPLAVFYVLPPSISHVIPGETERVWQFAFPVAAVGAAKYLLCREWTHSKLIGGLTAISLLQAIALQVCLHTYW